MPGDPEPDIKDYCFIFLTPNLIAFSRIYLTTPGQSKADRKEEEEAAYRTSLIVIMADPFEVRMRFSSQLQHLNASVSSAQKAAQYAIKYKDMDEDLHSCILEQVERVRSNSYDLP